MLRVLFVGARPRDQTALALKDEVEKIISRVYKAGLSERIQLSDRWAAQFSDLTGWLLDDRPDIVHFSGHGTADAELVFEDELGRAEPVPRDAIVSLLSARLVKRHVRCVVLNACYGAALAQELSEHIDFVIGCPTPVSDVAAVAFSEAFYQTLARGHCLQDAMDLAGAQFRAKRKGSSREIMGAAGQGERLLAVPRLFVRDGANAEEWPAPVSVRGKAKARAPEPPVRVSAVPRRTSEPWMKEEGEDRSGRYASFEVGGVVHRMRWIPAGTFRMGSPESEAGRFEDEGPQHPVTLTRGYWLGETPCTQALWQAAMGANPSRFQSMDRPVERVSWNDCRAFLEKLRALVPGLSPRFPAEAEWEYACRAGTSAATWAGDLDIRGANDAPVLDAIAWYGGNGGVGFELDNGEDAGDWPEKQYPHTKAGTHPVGKKAPNPFGLYDMLGNVYEWCEDGMREYTEASVTDPRGPIEASPYRVFRGGSWRDYARYVRAAGRLAYGLGARFADLGFRIAGG